MNNRLAIIQDERAKQTPEQRQLMALESIENILANLTGQVANMERSLSSLAQNIGEIAGVMKNPNFSRK